MALQPLRCTPTALLRPTKPPDAAHGLSFASARPSPSPLSSPVPQSASDYQPPAGSCSNAPSALLIHDTPSLICQLHDRPSPTSNCLREASCTMGLFNGVKNAVKRVGGKRNNGARRGKSSQSKQRASTKPQSNGDGFADDEESSLGLEPDERVSLQQPDLDLDPVAPQPQPCPRKESRKESHEELEHDCQQQSRCRSDPSMFQPSKLVAPHTEQPQHLPVIAQEPFVHKPRPKSEPCSSSIHCVEQESQDDVASWPAVLSRPGFEAAHQQAPKGWQSMPLIDDCPLDGDKSPAAYRFPFSSRQSEDHQSFSSVLEKAPSYSRQGRVDSSHPLPVAVSKPYNASIRAELVGVSREDVRKPTLRAQREKPPLEHPQYHGIEQLSSAENDEPLFAGSRRKLSDEPVSPTTQLPEMGRRSPLKYCRPIAESVADSDLADRDACELQDDPEPDASEASSDAESIVSELLPNRTQQYDSRLRRASMSPVPRVSFRGENMGSSGSIRSAEWMRGAPPSSFYPHSDEPDPPAARTRHLAGNHFLRHYRGPSNSPVYNYSPAKQRPSGRPKFSSRPLFPSPEDVERRVLQAREKKRQEEFFKRALEQRAKEVAQREREKEIYHARITKLEYEKRKLAQENGQISLKNNELEKRCTQMASRFTEQRRMLTELEMQKRAQEDFEARLQNNPHGLLTPPDTASSRSTPAGPERVRAWAETLAEPALLNSEALRAQEASQEPEAMQEHGGLGRELRQADNKASCELPDPASTKSSPAHPAKPTHSHLETLPEMSVEFIVQPQPFPAVHKHPTARPPERKAPTPIYSRPDGTVATFGSEQSPVHRNEPELENEQAQRNAKRNNEKKEARHDSVSHQVSQSPVKQYDEQVHRHPPKQVQFEGRPQEASTPNEATPTKPRRYRDVVKLFLKQQPKPVSTGPSPPITPLPRQPILRNKTSFQQMFNNPAVNSTNHPPMSNPSVHQIHDYPDGRQVTQRQQLGNREIQMMPMQQHHPTTVSRQHSMPQLGQTVQSAQYAHQHAHSSPQIPTLNQSERPRGLATHAKNQPRPEAPRKPSAQIFNPFRPSTSHSQHKAAPNTTLRPSTSHGARLPQPSPLPPRPGTSHSTRGGGNLGGSLAPPPVPQLPQGYQSMRSSPQQQQFPITGASSYVYPPPNPLMMPPPTFAANTGGSARSHDTSASHRTQLSKMQHRAYKGLQQNERANAERSAQAAAEANDRRGAAQREREEMERLKREQQPLLAQMPQARARDVLGEGTLRARIREEVMREEKKRIEEERERRDTEERIRRDLEREVRERSRIEGWA
ncbi:hypothetical protein B0J12DRAFT_699361 [Macrophomina phaseolina]|uniref:Uncharacterized protein n=1 Tax=Macrophomina phaseolina TaxID=35725 RepID=A0ABQ8GCU8_9PEZI|nr:hypothetical protein B0J12DRAFT_699361 [Macrophomina phaseolina]